MDFIERVATMLPRWLISVFMTLLAFLPTVFVLLLLWHFEALQEGGPLIVVILVPALGWCVTHVIRVIHNRKNTIQNVIEADLPPKYEKVMSDPPPYEVLYIGKPLATSSSSCGAQYAADLNPSRNNHFPSSFAETESNAASATLGHCSHWPEPSVSFMSERDAFVNIRKKRTGRLVTVTEESATDISLPGECARGLDNAAEDGAKEMTNATEDNAKGGSVSIEERVQRLETLPEESSDVVSTTEEDVKEVTLQLDGENVDPNLPSYHEAITSCSRDGC